MIYPCVELDIGIASGIGGMGDESPTGIGGMGDESPTGIGGMGDESPTGIGGMGDESPTPHKIEKNSLYSLLIKNKST